MEKDKNMSGVKRKVPAITLPENEAINYALVLARNPHGENTAFPHNVSTVDISHTFFLHFNSHRLTPPFCICKPVLPTGRLVAPYPDATKNARRRIQRAQSFSQFARSGQRRRRVISPKGDVTPVKMQCKYNHDSLITDVLLTEINKTVLI